MKSTLIVTALAVVGAIGNEFWAPADEKISGLAFFIGSLFFILIAVSDDIQSAKEK